MMRKVVLAVLAAASLSFAVVDTASARGFGGGGFHGGGGFRGGGGGFRGGGFGYRGGYGRGLGFGAVGLGLGLGYYGSSFAYGPGYGYGGYPYYAYSGYDDGGCYLVRRRVATPYGYRVRRVQVCG